MTPLLVDPEPAAHASTIRSILDAVLPFAVTALGGWLLSQFGVGRRLKRSDALTAKHLRELRDEIKALIEELRDEVQGRMESTEQDLSRVAQEVWGAQQTNGLRGEVKQLREQSAEAMKALASIAAKLEILLKRAS